MKEHRISHVEQGSIAEETGIEAGDVLLSVNGKEVGDIFDYRLFCQEEQLTVLIRKGDTSKDAGEEWEIEIEKDPYEDPGLIFEKGLMDEYRSCCNGCVFCFIDQMPKGMRKTLYFKDDDARLSFLQGNYVTLTNMSDRDIDRILEYHLSPINISFHTTNPELRVRMLRHPKAGEEALSKARRLAREGTGIELNGQIVLCKGLNDGHELDRTMRDLLHEYAPGLVSVSVVPVGLTRYRKGLYPLEAFTSGEAKQVLSQIHTVQEEALRTRNTRFVYAADEWYLMAARKPCVTKDTDSAQRRRGTEEEEEERRLFELTDTVDNILPKAEEYDGYPQLENGVGMTRLLVDEFREGLRLLTRWVNALEKGAGEAPEGTPVLRTFSNEISFCTGMLILPVLEELFSEAMAICPGLCVHLYPVRNDFFGEQITVSGLLTGKDIIRQCKGRPFGSKLCLPASLLRSGERVLLDDVTVDEIEEALGITIAINGHSGFDLVSALFDLPEGYFDADRLTPDPEINPYEIRTEDAV